MLTRESYINTDFTHKHTHTHTHTHTHSIQGKFLLIDFNPYCRATDPLLYSWEELSHESEKLLLQLDTTSSTLTASGTVPSAYSSDTRTDVSSDTRTDVSSSTDGSSGSGHSSACDGGWEKVSSLPLMRVVDGETIQPSDLQSFRLPKVQNMCQLLSVTVLEPRGAV